MINNYIKILLITLAFRSFIFAQNIIDSTLSSDSTDLKQLLNQKTSAQFSQMEKDLNQDVGVASKKAVSYRKTPSIITIITEEEIQKSGARDIIDVLRQVPGFDFGIDVQGVVGLCVRGNWALEGKHLLLIDGQEINETLYGSVNYANNYPLSHIKKIEIIRGSGSAIYGGFSEYSVINIITKTSEDAKLQADIKAGATANSFSRLQTSVLLANNVKGLQYSLGAMVGTGSRSDLPYTDMEGNTIKLNKNASQMNPFYVNFALKYKSFSARFMYDELATQIQVGTGAALSQTYPTLHKNYFAELKHIATLSEKLSITSRLNYKWQRPYYTPKEDANPDEVIYFEAQVQRFRANVIASYDPAKKINILAGCETFLDYGKNNAFEFNSFKNNVAMFYNLAGFAQILYKNKYITPTLGFRVDKNTSFSKLVYGPRFGIVSKIGKFNLKAQYSQSFRSPTLYNVALSNVINDKGEPVLNPEVTKVFEFETGIALTRNSYLAVNLFDITTYDPILYSVDEQLVETYKNGDTKGSKSLGTLGYEIEYKVKDTWGYCNINYAFYTNAGKGIIADYAVEGYNLQVSNVNLGIAQHKVNLNAALNITPNISIAPSCNILGNRYAATAQNENGNFITKFEPIFLANLFINFTDIFQTKGLQFGVGCFDIFNKKYHFLQAYTNSLAPFPSLSREVVVKMAYNISK